MCESGGALGGKAAGVNEFGGLEVWRGGVNTWECDEMGHMNVRFYVARAMEGLIAFGAAIGLEGAFRASADATLIVRDHHIRFLREARAGAPLYMTAGLIEIGESQARVLQLLIHAGSGELAASFQTLITHATTRDGRPFPWSDRTRSLAEGVMMQIPDRAAPRSLGLGATAGDASLARADALGLIALSAGAFGAQDCDVFGRVRPELFIGRVSDGVPSLAAAFGGRGAGAERPERVGGAVLEYRLAYHAWPRAGDRFAVRSGLAGFDDRAQRVVHWILDPASGEPWVTSEAVAIALDLDARKIIPISDETKARLATHVTPGLGL
jgi:acyl-CoA thioester hydrolase